MVALAAPSAAQVSSPRPQTATTVSGLSQLNGFSVVLVEGSTSGGSATEGVPAAAAKALADMKDFLPYKSYRLLDTQWTLGAGRIASRLRGAGTQEYDLVLSASGGLRLVAAPFGEYTTMHPANRAIQQLPPGQVTISQFSLREADPLAPRAGAPAAPKPAFDRPGSLINTSFSMNVGETVVVGTSRLQGDKALIVLLTAVAK
jgi:hypothetical protein